LFRVQTARRAKDHEVWRDAREHVLHATEARHPMGLRMRLQHGSVDIADGYKFYIVSVLFERTEVVLRNTAATHQTHPDLAVFDYR
jgi:hypothetical protein